MAETQEEKKVDMPTFEEAITGLSPEDAEVAKAQVEHYSQIFDKLNQTFNGLVYNPAATIFIESTSQSVQMAVEAVKQDLAMFIIQNGAVPSPVTADVLLKIIRGIHTNILASVFSELAITNAIEGFMDGLEKAILDTIEELPEDDAEAEEEITTEEDN